MNRALVFLATGAASSLVLGTLFAVIIHFDKESATMGQVMPDEHPIDTVAYEASDNSSLSDSTMGYINTTAFWKENGQVYAFMQVEDGVKHAADIKKLVQNAVYGNSSASDAANYTGWNVLMNAVLDQHDKHMPLLLIDQVKDANVIITFTNREDDTGHNAYGRAILKLDNNDRTSLSSVQIFIFKADQQYERNTLQPVITHELGHAFGLQHSTSLKSIMYPKIVMMDDRPVGAIEECEFNAIQTLYVESQVGKVPCENISPWIE